jgi:hypothetical protein
VAISANQCRVNVDKPGGENSLITFYPQPVTAGTDLSKTVGAVGDAIGKAIGAVVKPPKKGKKPKSPPTLIPLPPRPPVGVGNLGAAVAVSFLQKNGSLIPISTPPAKIISENAGQVIGQNGASVVGQNGASVIGQNGATIISENGGQIFAPKFAGAAASRSGQATTAKKRKGKKGRTVTYLLGQYSATMNGTAQTPTLALTGVGRQLLRRIGKLNGKRKKRIVPKATLVEVFQPQDKGDSGGTYTEFELK